GAFELLGGEIGLGADHHPAELIIVADEPTSGETGLVPAETERRLGVARWRRKRRVPRPGRGEELIGTVLVQFLVPDRAADEPADVKSAPRRADRERTRIRRRIRGTTIKIRGLRRERRHQ